jgi:hypothetical protein
MTFLNRRGFVKTVLGAAAGASPGYAKVRSRISFLTFAKTNASSPTILENEEQQLRLSSVGAPPQPCQFRRQRDARFVSVKMAKQ